MKTIHHINLNHILETYTEQVKREAAEAEAIREGLLPRPVPAERLRVTDLH